MIYEECDLNHNIIKAVAELGYKEATEIQAQAIPHILNSKKDLLGLAQTGTGKTAAFGLPIIHQIDIEDRRTQAIILSPTRELCVQIAKDISDYSKYVKGINIVAVYGGASIDTQIKALNRGAHIVVATPGRAMDLMRRRRLVINNIKWVVLDEADEMLNMGFKDDIDIILKDTPKTKQTLLFSASMPKDIVKIIKQYMDDPKEIVIGTKNAGAKNVKHVFYKVQAKDRYQALKRIADINPSIFGLVFCRTRSETKDIADKLIQDGYSADALHGDLSQAQRDHVMKRFRSHHLQMLVATDVAARGIDVDDITHVINYSLPDDNEVYLHRSGRTGRAGKSGISIAIVHSRRNSKLKEIERLIGKSFEQGTIPSGHEICIKQLFNHISKLESIEVDEEKIAEYLPDINSKLEWLSKDELIKRIVSYEFTSLLDYYKSAPDLNLGDSRDERSERGDRRERGERRDRNERGDRGDRGDRGIPMTKFFINIGGKDDLSKRNLLELINSKKELRRAEIGKIEILNGFSFFQLESSYSQDVLKTLNGEEFEGRSIVVEEKKAERGARSSSDRGSRSSSDRSSRSSSDRGSYDRGDRSGSDRSGSDRSGSDRRRSSNSSDSQYRKKRRR